MILAPDVVAPVTSLTASSIMGWGGFIFGLIACVILIWDRVVERGRTNANLEGKIDGLCERVEDFGVTQGIMDEKLESLSQDVRDLRLAWRGENGKNGAKNQLKDHDQRLDAIERRHHVQDEIAKHESQYPGPERRQGYRRELDRAILPEPNERGDE